MCSLELCTSPTIALCILTVVVFCNGLCWQQREVSLRRGEHGQRRTSIQNTVGTYVGLEMMVVGSPLRSVPHYCTHRSILLCCAAVIVVQKHHGRVGILTAYIALYGSMKASPQEDFHVKSSLDPLSCVKELSLARGSYPQPLRGNKGKQHQPIVFWESLALS